MTNSVPNHHDNYSKKMSNSLGTKLGLEIKLINFKMSKIWLALVQTLKLLTTFYLHTKKKKNLLSQDSNETYKQ